MTETYQTLPTRQTNAPHPVKTVAKEPFNLQSVIWAILQNLGTLALLAIAFPFNLAIVLGSLFWSWFRRSSPTLITAEQPKNILIAGGRMTKALQLARSFHAAGHRVILIDTEKFWHSGNQYSNTVGAFYTVPDPAKDLQGYVDTLRAIARQEKIDLFIPVAIFAVLYYDGMTEHPLADYCEVCHFDAETIQMLDDKFAFAEQARSLSLTVPKTYRMTSPEQVLNFDFSNEKRKYILKSIPYDAKHRLDLTKLPCETPEATASFVNRLPISEAKPWILQEFIPGQEYCTHSTVRDGRSTLYCCCESSAFQVNYQQVDKPEIAAWIERFLSAVPGYGQASFDLIQAEDGTVYAIECNPRTHSAITMFYNHPGVAAAYLDPQAPSEPLRPLTSSKPTYWLYHELWRLNEVRSLKQLQRWINTIWQGKEAIFRVDDPLPFLMVHHWQIPLQLLDSLRKFKRWIRIDFNIGELIE
ncbi:ATP-grasp enzyme [Oscillatoria sp. FACHB-1407]|nr:ATP-grasp enzyme [Oscillatoria sp. FACHB-1407]MBD2463486.1 ATP-grasp enzyme [Oscillatoria sp. FACHB-1407]